MSSGCNDILKMLDYLKLPVMAESLERMMDDPASFELPVLDFLKQIVSDEYVELLCSEKWSGQFARTE